MSVIAKTRSILTAMSMSALSACSIGVARYPLTEDVQTIPTLPAATISLIAEGKALGERTRLVETHAGQCADIMVFGNKSLATKCNNDVTNEINVLNRDMIKFERKAKANDLTPGQ